MMAAPGPMPSGPGWSYEMKWDGIRIIAEVDDGVAGCGPGTAGMFPADIPS